MAQQIPVHLKKKNAVTQENDHLLPTTLAELVVESDDRRFISKRKLEEIDEKQDKLGYVPLNQEGDTMQGPLFLSGDSITFPRQAVTKQYVDQITASIDILSPADIETIFNQG